MKFLARTLEAIFASVNKKLMEKGRKTDQTTNVGHRAFLFYNPHALCYGSTRNIR